MKTPLKTPKIQPKGSQENGNTAKPRKPRTFKPGSELSYVTK